jgi:hypothetical protein
MQGDNDGSSGATRREQTAPATAIGRVRLAIDAPAPAGEPPTTPGRRWGLTAQALLLGAIAILVMIGSLLVIFWFVYHSSMR